MTVPHLAAVVCGAAVLLVAAVLAPRPRSRVPDGRADQAGSTVGHERRAPAPRHRSLRRRRRRSRSVGPVAVAEWCDGIARSVRSGSTMRTALAVEPDDVDLRAATSELRALLGRGRTIVEATDRVERVREPNLAMAISVIAATTRVGELRADPFDRVAAALRLRDADRQERAVHSAQAAMSARVMTALPVGMLAILAATDGDVRATVLQPAGAAVVAAGAALNAIGWLWMRHVVRAAR